jgi:hypothetical protein
LTGNAQPVDAAECVPSGSSANWTKVGTVWRESLFYEWPFSARDAPDLAKAVRFRKRFTAVIEKPFHNMTLSTNNTFDVS